MKLLSFQKKIRIASISQFALVIVCSPSRRPPPTNNLCARFFRTRKELYPICTTWASMNCKLCESEQHSSSDIILKLFAFKSKILYYKSTNSSDRSCRVSHSLATVPSKSILSCCPANHDASDFTATSSSSRCINSLALSG
jgi:hypothetical protein